MSYQELLWVTDNVRKKAPLDFRGLPSERILTEQIMSSRTDKVISNRSFAF